MANASWNGLGSGNFVNTSSVSGGLPGGRTLIDTVVTDAMLQAGSILAVKYRGRNSGTPSTNGCRFCVYRKNGSNFDFVGASETFTMDVSNVTVTRTLSTPIAGVRVGDYCGLWMDDSSGAFDNELWVIAGGTLKYVEGAMPTGTNITFAGSLANTLCLEFFGAQPTAAMTGDSIEVGHGGTFTSFFDGTGPAVGADGTPACELGYNMISRIGGTWNYQDMAKGSQTFAWVLSTGVPAILTGAGTHESVGCGATELWIHCGVNDIAASRSNATIQADLDSIRTLWGTVNPMFIDEVLPDTNFTDPQAAAVRSWNTALAAWAVGKSNVKVVSCWAALGQTRVSTGFKDDLLAAYNSGDGVHINAAGAGALAAIRVGARNSFLGIGGSDRKRLSVRLGVGV